MGAAVGRDPLRLVAGAPIGWPGYTPGVSSYVPQSADTTAEAEKEQFGLWRKMTSVEKLRLTGELCEGVRYLAHLGLRERYPDASEEEIRMRLFATWLDRETMVRCWGWDPREH